MRTGASMSSLWRTPGSVKLVGAKAGLFDMKGPRSYPVESSTELV
jgi:hypothetical protein